MFCHMTPLMTPWLSFSTLAILAQFLPLGSQANRPLSPRICFLVPFSSLMHIPWVIIYIYNICIIFLKNLQPPLSRPGVFEEKETSVILPEENDTELWTGD